MKLPRVLTVDERRIIARALGDAAAATRTAIAAARTKHELLSQYAQDANIVEMRRLSEEQSQLSVLFNNSRSMDVAFIEPQLLTVTEDAAHRYPNNPRRRRGG